jgi:hypothetical protein
VRLLKPEIGQVAAVAGMTAQRRPPELARIVDKEEDELEGVREADIVKLCGRGEGNRRVAGVESSAEAAVG